jgi:hypothetical protein
MKSEMHSEGALQKHVRYDTVVMILAKSGTFETKYMQ